MIVLNLVKMEQGMDRREQKRKRGKRRRSPYVRASLMMEKSNTKIKRLDDCSEPGDDGAGKEMLRKHSSLKGDLSSNDQNYGEPKTI